MFRCTFVCDLSSWATSSSCNICPKPWSSDTGNHQDVGRFWKGCGFSSRSHTHRHKLPSLMEKHIYKKLIKELQRTKTSAQRPTQLVHRLIFTSWPKNNMAANKSDDMQKLLCCRPCCCCESSAWLRLQLAASGGGTPFWWYEAGRISPPVNASKATQYGLL